MLRQLKFRDQLILMAACPLLVIITIAIGLLVAGGTGNPRVDGLAAAVGLLVSGSLALLIGRSILASMAALTRSTEGLAAAHRRLADGEIAAEDIEPIPVEGDGHLAELAGAINALNTATLEAAESQRGAVKAGLSTIVVNLARRSQKLLDRQVEYLDRLESSEEDPDRLSELFKVDHLATRMRRNAESLMVLAEADPGRRRGGAVEIGDVLRVAMGEVETYEHIELGDIAEGQVSAGVAVDLAHLTAELMENATQFSPPNTPVEVNGGFDGDGRFVITIGDSGIGFTDEKLIAINQLLADPPELGLGMGRSLGFMVIGRLAQRLGATVTIEPNGPLGAKAVVSVPGDLLGSNAPGAIRPAPTPNRSGAETAVDGPVAAADGAVGAAFGPAAQAPLPPAPEAGPVPTGPDLTAGPGPGPNGTVAGVGTDAPVPSPVPQASSGSGATPPAGPAMPGSTAPSDPAPPGPGPASNSGPAAPAGLPPALAGVLPAVGTDEHGAGSVAPSPAATAPPSFADLAQSGAPSNAHQSPALQRLLGLTGAPSELPAEPQTPVDWASTSPFGDQVPPGQAPTGQVLPDQAATEVPMALTAPSAPTEPSTPAGPPPEAPDPHWAEAPTPSLESEHWTSPEATAPPGPSPRPGLPPILAGRPDQQPRLDGDPPPASGSWFQSHDPATAAPGNQPAPPQYPDATTQDPLSGPDSWVPPTPPVRNPGGFAFSNGTTPAPVTDPGPWSTSEVTSNGSAHPGQAVPPGGGFDPSAGNDRTQSGLAKRQRGASAVPHGDGRPVAATRRDPEEVRNRLARYREGLRGHKPSDRFESGPSQIEQAGSTEWTGYTQEGDR